MPEAPKRPGAFVIPVVRPAVPGASAGRREDFFETKGDEEAAPGQQGWNQRCHVKERCGARRPRSEGHSKSPRGHHPGCHITCRARAIDFWVKRAALRALEHPAPCLQLDTGVLPLLTVSAPTYTRNRSFFSKHCKGGNTSPKELL